MKPYRIHGNQMPESKTYANKIMRTTFCIRTVRANQNVKHTHTHQTIMPVSSLDGLSDAQKQELVASLSAIVVGSSGGEVSAEALTAVATASGNDLSGAWASVFASAVGKVR